MSEKAKSPENGAEVKKNAKAGTKKQMTLAACIDAAIAKGGTWKELIEKTNSYNKSVKSSFVNSKGTLNAHIKYRIKTNADYLGEKQITEEGVF